MQIRSQGQEDSLEEGMATHSSIPAWRIPWTEEPGRLQSMVLERVRHSWATFTHFSCLKAIIPSFQVISFLFSHCPISLLLSWFQVSHLFFSVAGGILLITTLKWVLERKESDPPTPCPPIQALPLTLVILLAPTLLISDATIVRTRPASLEEAPGSSHGLCKVLALRLSDHPTKEILLDALNPGKSPSFVQADGL